MAGVIALGAISIAARIGLWLWHPDTPQSVPAVVNPGPAGAFARTLPAGTCVLEAYPAGYIRPVACTDRHGSEIVAQLTYPAPPGAAYPPAQDAFGRALDLCETAFKAYAGAPADQTPARFFVVLPAAYEWRGGERIVTCFANGRNGTELTTSVKAAPK